MSDWVGNLKPVAFGLFVRTGRHKTAAFAIDASLTIPGHHGKQMCSDDAAILEGASPFRRTPARKGLSRKRTHTDAIDMVSGAPVRAAHQFFGILCEQGGSDQEKRSQCCQQGPQFHKSPHSGRLKTIAWFS